MTGLLTITKRRDRRHRSISG